MLQPVVRPQLLLPPEELVAHLAPGALVLVEVAELDVPLAVGPVGGPLLADGAEPDSVHLSHVVCRVVGGGQLGIVAAGLVALLVVVVVVAFLEICNAAADPLR